MKSGELFAGVGGLGMAVTDVFGAEPAWFAEFDPAPSKVLAHHYPGIPNHGDVTKLTAPEPVQVLAGGFPCQDVSLAGRRRGLKDGTRSGLWSEYARIIDQIRPDWVVIENVRGLLSADANSDMEPCPLCVGDNPGHVLRALGAVLGDLADLGFDAEWTGIRAADVGAPHGRFRVFTLAWPRERTAPYPEGVGWSRRLVARKDVEQDGQVATHPGPSGGTPLTLLLPTPRTTDMNGPGAHGDGGMDLRTAATLLPTPTSGDHDRGKSATRAGGPMLTDVTDWGPYAHAIRRWEQIIGRPAPAPVRFDGKGGKPRLNPELTEWMMGWPAGWVTDPSIGLSRAEQLKACGNGVVTLQAVAALNELLARPGVPPIHEGHA